MLRVRVRTFTSGLSVANGKVRGDGFAETPCSRGFLRTACGVAAAMALVLAPSSPARADSLEEPAATPLEIAAASYIRYREDVAAIEATPFDKPATTREAHKRLAAHDPDALTVGWVAYAALVAADTPEFLADLQQEMKKKKRQGRRRLKGRDAFFATLAEDPTYPRRLPGGKAAIERVLAMTAQDASRFNKLGEAFKAQAYAMQKTKWGKKKIGAGSARIDEANAYASKRPAAALPPFQPLRDKGVTAPSLASVEIASWRHDWGATGASGRMSDARAEAVMDRILNLAARYAVGGLNDKLVSVYAQNAKSQQCLSMAKLTLTQCIAATRTPYEEAFCLGEHGLNDIGACVGWVADAGAS